MQQVHILLADNNKDFLNTRAEFLEHVGYKVFRAYSPAEAELLLMTARIHVAILDIRLTNDEDERDTSGLTLAKKRLYQAVPKIILTGYPSYQYVRDVLGRAVDELPAAVDFLAKSEGPEAMITAVQKTVTKHLGINWDLQIEWGKYVSVEQLMRLILPGLDRADWLMRAAELEDLFRKLFAQFDQLLVDRLLSQVDGRVILSLIGFFADGRESQFIVSCGVSGIVLDEEERFKTAVPEQSKVNLRRWNSAQTVHFACLAFSFHGGDLEESYQLEKLFKQGGEQVLTVVDRTYQQLARWYDRGRYKNTAVSLDTYYRNRFALSVEMDLRTLDEKVTDLCEKGVSSNVATMQTAGSHLVVMLNAQTERHLLHPISWLRGATLSARTGLIWGITHGRVHVETILGNANGDAWLIDFAQVEQAPLLIDFVSLETAVKTNLINSRQITDRYQLELLLRQSMSSNALTSAESFPVELISCAALIFKIRENAAQILNIDLRTYQQALFFEALAFLATYDMQKRMKRRELTSYVHMLLSAALLAKELAGEAVTAVPKDAINGLWIDEVEQQVWVEGKQIKITMQDYQILDYLWRNLGKVCDRKAIIKDGLGEPVEPYQMDESRLNSAMSRLRHKIEPEPDNPRYLLTERGRGYRLQPN